MTAEQFWNEFKKNFENNSLKEAKEKWKIKKEFTEFIKNKIGTFLAKPEYGYENKHQNEYYNIDVYGWYDGKDSLNNTLKLGRTTLKNHFWFFEVAVEHENDTSDWLDEIVKLCYISCPLRVVIGYLPPQANDSQIEEATKHASHIICSLNKKYGNIISNNQEYLLILGKHIKDTEELCPDIYTPYLYKNGIFENMSNKTNWS